MEAPFRIGVSRDLRLEDGDSRFPLDELSRDDRISWEFLGEDVDELRPDQVSPYDAVIFYGPAVTARTVGGNQRPRLLARLGVGVDRVDTEACSEAGVLVAVAPDAARESMATAALTLVLALAHGLPAKERALRDGSWQPFSVTGTGVQRRVLGIVGLGRIGSRLSELAICCGMDVIAYTPSGRAHGGVRLVDLDTVMVTADVVCVTSALSPTSHRLVDARRIGLMRPDAYLVNVSRGAVVDQQALTQALARGAIAGAALDVFVEEPLPDDDPLREFPNVILTPHALGVTDELIAETARSVCRSVTTFAAGGIPDFIANPDVLGHPFLAERRP